MGTHFVNSVLVGDGDVDPSRPEALLYEGDAASGYRLVAAEYIVFQAAWDAAHAEPPSLFGQTFRLVPAPNRCNIDAFYELHVWAWKKNPLGTFEDWNPTVICP